MNTEVTAGGLVSFLQGVRIFPLPRDVFMRS